MTNEERIAQVSERIIAAGKERADAEAAANALEDQARAERRRMSDLKKEIGELSTVLQHAQVAKSVNDAQAAAMKAKVEAEATAKRIADQEKAAAEQQAAKLAEVDAKLAELDAALEAAKNMKPPVELPTEQEPPKE